MFKQKYIWKRMFKKCIYEKKGLQKKICQKDIIKKKKIKYHHQFISKT